MGAGSGLPYLKLRQAHCLFGEAASLTAPVRPTWVPDHCL